MGQLSEARSLATHAFEVSHKLGMTQIHAQALLRLALCDLIERNFAGAEEYILLAERESLENGLVYEQVWCCVGRARIALSKRDFEQAQAEIENILDISGQRNMAWMKLRGLHFYSQLHNATGDPALLRYRPDLNDMLETLSEHTQSQALRPNFEKATSYWKEGHAYP